MQNPNSEEEKIILVPKYILLHFYFITYFRIKLYPCSQRNPEIDYVTFQDTKTIILEIVFLFIPQTYFLSLG